MGACLPERIILFGSAARDEMTEASDIIFHTVESFRFSCDKGGGASWIASREGIVIFKKEQS